MSRGSQGARREDLHAFNLSAVLSALRTHGPVARFQIAELIGLSRGAISAICDELLGQGLLVEIGTGGKRKGSRGGPRPTLLDVNANARLAIGIQFSKKQVKVGLVNLKGQVLATRRHTVRPGSPSAEATVERACQLATELLDAVPSRDPVLGVGVGAPGVVDGASGIVRSDPYLGWQDVPLKRLIEDRLSLFTQVDHNVRAMALAELRYGAGRSVDSFLELYWSTGIGSGLAIRGDLYTPGSYGDGQLGHVVVDPMGPACVCGNRGCLETLAGEDALLRRLQGSLPDRDWSVEAMVEAAKGGARKVTQVLEEAACHVATACADLINVLGPLAVVVGGPLASTGETILRPLRETLAWRVHPHIRDRVTVLPSALGQDLGLIGAASLILESRFFAPTRP